MVGKAQEFTMLQMHKEHQWLAEDYQCTNEGCKGKTAVVSMNKCLLITVPRSTFVIYLDAITFANCTLIH